MENFSAAEKGVLWIILKAIVKQALSVLAREAEIFHKIYPTVC